MNTKETITLFTGFSMSMLGVLLSERLKWADTLEEQSARTATRVLLIVVAIVIPIVIAFFVLWRSEIRKRMQLQAESCEVKPENQAMCW